jgi:hypothetical protein
MASVAGFTPAPAVDPGRWRLTGAIRDGKCTGGSMPRARYDLLVLPVQIEGHLKPRDDLLIVRFDQNTIRQQAPCVSP